jgi:thiol-disulfide isomerase/thioredoxin
MTRRACIGVLGAVFTTKSKSESTARLIPLDEADFHQMVASHHGKILLVDFWATWCAPCREELPKLVALHAANKNKGFELVTVSCDEPEQEAAAAQFVAAQGAPPPNYIRRAQNDDAFINAIDPKWSGALPALFLFDRNGRQARSFIGETDIKQLTAYIEKLLIG